MNYGILSCLPVFILIIGAMVTRKLPEMLVLSSFVGAVILFKSGCISGWIGLMYTAMSNESGQYIVLILVFCGILIRMLEKSGAMLGFRNIIAKYADTEQKVMFFTWILGVIIFVDDYLNSLAVSAAMKSLSDGKKIPREHLSYTVNVTGACVCVLVPFSSWAAFGIGTFSEYGWTFSDYVHAMPFMFYPIIAQIITLLVGFGIIPKLGDMKKAYKRVREEGGPTLPPGCTEDVMGDDIKATTPLNFLIPMVALVIGMIAAGNDLIFGMLIAVIVQCIMYVGQRLMTIKEFFTNVFEGIYSMVGTMVICVLCFMMNAVNSQIGFSEYVIGILGDVVPATLLPVICFALVGFTAYTSGSFWPLIVIVSPIFIPMAISLNVYPPLIIAGMMSAIAFASQGCMYSDTVVMTAAGTGVDCVSQVRCMIPYLIVGFGLSCVLFAIAGFIF